MSLEPSYKNIHVKTGGTECGLFTAVNMGQENYSPHQSLIAFCFINVQRSILKTTNLPPLVLGISYLSPQLIRRRDKNAWRLRGVYVCGQNVMHETRPPWPFTIWKCQFLDQGPARQIGIFNPVWKRPQSLVHLGVGPVFRLRFWRCVKIHSQQMTSLWLQKYDDTTIKGGLMHQDVRR